MGQAVLVTGSSRGIGRASALALADRGFAVAINGRTDSDALRATVDEARRRGVEAVGIAGDVADDSAHDSMLDRAEAAIGPLTTLVNNAGVGPLGRFDVLESTAESFDHCVAHNTRAVYFLTQRFARRLLARERPADLHHAIVIVSSISGFAASVDKADYCVSKAGATMVAKVFAMRLAGEGIQVFDIQPGIIETDLARPVLPAYQRLIDEQGLTLVPRFGQPEEVARAVVAAATGALPYTVGQVLRPDGGLTLDRL